MGLFNSLAQSYELTNGVCRIDGVQQATTQPCDDAFTTGFIWIGGFLGAIVLIFLVSFIFWLIALIHAINNQDIKDRNIWLAVLAAGFFLGFAGIAGVVYYFAVMRPYKKEKNSVAQPQVSPQPVQSSQQSQQTTNASAQSSAPQASPAPTQPDKGARAESGQQTKSE